MRQYAGAKYILRHMNTLDFGSNQRRTIELERNESLIGLCLNLRGQLTLTAGNNTRALTERGDEWGVVRRLEVIANNHTRLFSVPGWMLPWIEAYDLGNGPNLSLNIGDAGATPTFDSSVFCYFSPPRMNLQTPLDTKALDSFRVEVDWGSYLNVNATSTAFEAEPIMDIYGLVQACDCPPPPDGAYRQVLATSKEVSQTMERYRIEFPQGPRYAGWGLFPQADGFNSGDIITRVDWRAIACSYLEGRYPGIGQIAAKEWAQGFIAQSFSQPYTDAITTFQYALRMNLSEPTHGVIIYDQARGDFWGGLDAAELSQLRLELEVNKIAEQECKIDAFFVQYLHSLCVNR